MSAVAQVHRTMSETESVRRTMTNSDDVDELAESNRTMQMTLMGSFSVVSGAANLTVVAVILSSARLRRSPHLYVSNVLLLALVASLVSVPLRMMIFWSSFNGNHDVDHFEDVSARRLCQLSTFSAILSQFGIAYTLLAASFDRYVTVVHGRLNVRRCSGLVYVPIMLCVWALAFVTALLEVYGHRSSRYVDVDDDDNGGGCRATPVTPSVLSSVTGTFAIVFLGCCATSNVLYLRTYIHTRHCRRMRPYVRAPLVHDGWSDTRIQLNGHDQRSAIYDQRSPINDQRLAIVGGTPSTYGLTALLSIICSVLWLPSLVLCLARSPSVVRSVHGGRAGGHDSSTNLVLVVTVAAWIELLHVLVLPVLYVCSCSTFRKELLKIRSSYE